MRRWSYVVVSMMILLVMFIPAGSVVKSSGSMQIIVPYDAGQASDSGFFPLNYAFDSTNISWDDLAGEPVGNGGANDAPYYNNRVGYIDFGPDWSNIRITSTWTKYRASSNGNQTPYVEVWWDDDIDSTNDSNLTESVLNFNSAQGLSTGTSTPWIEDSNAYSNPITPKARYLMLRSDPNMTNRASEYAIVGYIHIPVTSITVTGAGGADTITTNGGTLQLAADITPVNATVQTVTWSVENGTGSAMISTSGLLTAISNGTVTVRATADDGSNVSGTLQVTLSNQNQGTEVLQIITPVDSGVATGGAHFPLQNAFDSQPSFDGYDGVPVGLASGNDAPANNNRVGFIDFGPDWDKVRITSTWTQYRMSSKNDQTPYTELWWDDDKDTINDSGLTETRINFNTAQDLNTGATTPWIQDSDVSSNPVVPLDRYLMLRSDPNMSNRASEYAFVGWIDDNANGIQDVPSTAVSHIEVTSANDATSLLISESLQMSAMVYPYIATDKSYVWSVENGTGAATISSSGLLTPVSSGLVTVKATAQDGSNISGSKVINISQYEQFILPVQGQSSIYYPNVQTAFPQVNWQSIERLYIPAGNYEFINLGNLPERSPSSPMIITNYGGQVKIDGNYSYSFAIGGGSNWILTGEYDSDLETGHVDFPGHKDNNYANSAGNYGIWVDRSRSSSIGVGNKATDFELSFIEVSFAGFAGLLIKSDNDPTATMYNVKIHDMYIHDIESEGMYIGSTQGDLTTQHSFINLEIYNNRILRTGTEGLQLVNMGDGLKVYNNVVAMCATGWKDPFQRWQDGCFQYSQGSGSSEIYNNIFIGGASKTLQLWLTATEGEELDPDDEVWIHNNYFSHARNFFTYINYTERNDTTTLRFENNIIRQYLYHYDELPISHSDPDVLIMATPNSDNPMIFDDNLIDGSRTFIDTIGADNGSASNVSASGNVRSTSVASIEFNDVPFPANFDWARVELWFDTSSLYGNPVYYNEGDYVIYWPTGDLYLCIESGSHTGKNPLTNPSTWQLVTDPVDDYRLAPSSPYQGMGLMQ